jgi:hypothetical protein
MIYYILMKDDSPDDLSDANVLGEEDFKIFWPGEGMGALTYLINRQPSLLPDVRIIKSNGKEINIEKFLDEIKKFKIKKT